MLSSTSLQQPLQSLQINNQSNNGLIGDGSYNFVTSGNNNQVNITQVTTAAEEDDELDGLLHRYISKDALRTSFYSPPECHRNTRTTIRNEIGGWIDESGPKESPLLWLNGPAGVGKSVIAKTISGYHDRVVATFFFSTSSDRSATTLFPTLAWQLARRIPETRNHIIASLKNSDSLQTSQIEAQFDLLIIRPLKKITTTLNCRPVMVVDGVDECTDERMLARFLRVLVQTGERRDMPVRFIICSRPEPRIHAILGRVRVLPDVNRTTNEREPQSPPSRLAYNTLASMISIGLIGLIASIAFTGEAPRVHVLRNVNPTTNGQEPQSPNLVYASIAFNDETPRSLESPRTMWPLIVLISSGASIVSLAFFLLLPSFLTSSKAHLPTPIQRSRGFLQGVWELYRPIRLGVDKDAPSFPSSDRLADTDRICPHPVISAIQIGLSQESKDDISRYLTDKFNAIHRPGDDTSPWFRPCDISTIVEASCCQFLYAATIVRLLDEFHGDPSEVIEMARHSALPTPDLNKLYKAILKRAEDTIRNQAEEGGPNYQKERRFLMDSLAILVFFAGNIHFFTVRKGFLVIETLLGLERGKLTLKLRNMHSVLRIVPGETIQVHHRSFLEFLQSRERSGEYYIDYSNGLRRILILMTLAELRYLTIHLHRRSE